MINLYNLLINLVCSNPYVVGTSDKGNVDVYIYGGIGILAIIGILLFVKNKNK